VIKLKKQRRPAPGKESRGDRRSIERGRKKARVLKRNSERGEKGTLSIRLQEMCWGWVCAKRACYEKKRKRGGEGLHFPRGGRVLPRKKRLGNLPQSNNL